MAVACQAGVGRWGRRICLHRACVRRGGCGVGARTRVGWCPGRRGTLSWGALTSREVARVPRSGTRGGDSQAKGWGWTVFPAERTASVKAQGGTERGAFERPNEHGAEATACSQGLRQQAGASWGGSRVAGHGSKPGRGAVTVGSRVTTAAAEMGRGPGAEARAAAWPRRKCREGVGSGMQLGSGSGRSALARGAGSRVVVVLTEAEQARSG